MKKIIADGHTPHNGTTRFKAPKNQGVTDPPTASESRTESEPCKLPDAPNPGNPAITPSDQRTAEPAKSPPEKEPKSEPSTLNEAPDPFDVDRLRLAGNDADVFGVSEAILHIPFQKPNQESFFRCHPSPDYHLPRCGVIELKKENSETYWVDPSLWSSLVGEPTFGYRSLYTAVTTQGQVFLWGCRLPGADGKIPAWVSIPLKAAEMATSTWVKLLWDMTLRHHRVLAARGIKTEPKWPTLPLKELIRLAFNDAVITSMDHPVLQKLRGEI